MTGVEFASHLSVLRPSLPIILVSGYSAVVSEEAITKAGIRFFLRKPVPENLLPLKIREVLDGASDRRTAQQRSPVDR
jgi:FixJ family two-component response regulator